MDIPRLSASGWDQIFDELHAILQTRNSILLADEVVTHELDQQIEVILSTTLQLLTPLSASSRLSGLHAGPIAALQTADALPGQTGTLRAQQHVHPSESLEAAELLFEIALPVLLHEFRSEAEVAFAPRDIAQALHQCIMAQVIPASVAYVDVLLNRLSAAQAEERLRVSRDLHDRVAHGIAAGLQRLVLSHLDDTDVAGGLVDSAERLLSQTLEEVRDIALDLRQIVGGRYLDVAISEYLTDLSSEPVVTMSTSGERVKLPTRLSEEIFIIVREAIHNSRRHTRTATDIKVSICWEEVAVSISVIDNGGGFEPDEQPTGRMGLLSMQERAEAIGAHLTIHTKVPVGTEVLIAVPVHKEVR